MAQARKTKAAKDPLHAQLKALADPEAKDYVVALKARYAQYAVPLEEARKVIDKAMEPVTLTDVLGEMRREKDLG